MIPTNDTTPKETPNKIWHFIKKHGVSLLMAIALITMLVNPDAKSWVIQKMMLTGIFNATIDEKMTEATPVSNVDFAFTDAEGTLQNTASLRGKVVFINFWASWCGPCRAEFPSIQTLYSKFENDPNVVFLMVNPDLEDVEKAKAYLAKERFTMPFYQPASAVPDAIYTGTLPTTVVLDKKGAVRFQHEGFANYASEKFIKQLKDLLAE